VQFHSYKVNQKHRVVKPTENASVWCVSEWAEVQLFGTASYNNWSSPGKDILWAASSVNGELQKIGDDPSNALFIAKFRCDKNLEWHGYPVCPRNDDIPPERVLEAWRVANIIDKTDKRRIQKGQF